MLKFLGVCRRIIDWLLRCMGVFLVPVGILITICFIFEPDTLPARPGEVWGVGVSFGIYVGMLYSWLRKRIDAPKA